MGTSQRGFVPEDIRARGEPGRPLGKDPFGTLPKVLNIHLPWVAPIPSSQMLNVEGDRTTAAIETQLMDGTGGTTTLFNLPGGNIGVIRGVSVYITNMLATTNVLFTLLVNKAPAPGFGTIRMFPRVASSLSNSFECLLFLPASAEIQGQFTNIDGGTYTVGMSYTGWFHPEASANQWMAKGA